jgi:small-conductance mechanosensitive channel
MVTDEECPTCGAGRDLERDDLYAKLAAAEAERDSLSKRGEELRALIADEIRITDPLNAALATERAAREAADRHEERRVEMVMAAQRRANAAEEQVKALGLALTQMRSALEVTAALDCIDPPPDGGDDWTDRDDLDDHVDGTGCARCVAVAALRAAQDPPGPLPPDAPST